ITAGNTTGTVLLTAVQDTLDETNETIDVDITGVTNGTESDTQQVTARITDDELSVEEVAAFLQRQTVTGATIITHGYQPPFDENGDSLITLAQAVWNRANAENGPNETAWFLDYDLGDSNGQFVGLFDTKQSVLPNPEISAAGEVVLLFDWARESNESSSGWGEAAGDALFNLLVGLGLASPATATSVPLHLIGHSFGTAVTSEAVERLATFGIPVDQVTYLDPHDFDQGFLPVDGSQRLYELGRPDGYGATVWDNVAFADVYYQTRGSNEGAFLPDFIVPEGRPIPGAYNVLLDTELPSLDPDPYSFLDASGDHSYVWNCFYLGTVLWPDPLPEDCAPSASSVDFSSTGYAFSRILAQSRPVLVEIANQEFRFFSQPAEAQDHAHSPASLTDNGQPLNQNEVNFTRWEPMWNPLEILNGDFQHAGDELVPGWVDHGGGRVLAGACPGGFPCGDAFDGSLTLGSRTVSRTHNRFYIPAGATLLLFDLKRTDASDDDQLVVRIGEQVLTTSPLNSFDGAFATQTVEIPTALRDATHTLEFAIILGGARIEAEVQIDNVRMASANEAPTAIDLSTNTVAENAAGAIVGALAVSDPDANDTHTYVISDNRFEIAAGQLKLKMGQSLDFEATPSINLDTTATDAGGLDFTKSFTINVTNVNEAPKAITLTNVAAKENTPGIVIGQLAVTDEDVGDSHTLTVLHDDFELDGDILRLKEGRSLIHDEDDPIIIVPVTAVDSGGLSYTEQIAIVVLAHPLPWQNEENTADANADGSVSPVDALVIINHINEQGSGKLPVPPPTNIVFYYDTNGDSSISPVDVLIVVNLLNATTLSGEGVAGEGELPLLPSPIQPTPFVDSPTSSVNPTQRILSSGSTFTEPFPYFMRDAAQDDRQYSPATEYARNLEQIDLDDLLDELFALQAAEIDEDSVVI
ncbi:MAG: hypothetical protein HYV60_24115, partial [Planctomycetia bacterium]|nr:hypothetical protein [Planctomycetia bacterium]